MKLWMSGEVDADVAEAYRHARQFVEEMVNQRLQAREIDPAFGKWAVIAIIRREDSPDYNEVITKDRSGTLEFRLKIDHGTFHKSDADIRRDLVAEMLNRSIDKMGSLGVPTGVMAALRDVLRGVRMDRSVH
jgi:hypothetical protein